MIRIETDDLSINVPIKRRMNVDEFLAVADKLSRIQKAQEQPQHTVHMDNPAAFTLDHGEELHHIHTHLQQQMEVIKRQEEHISTILDYLDNLDRRKR